MVCPRLTWVGPTKDHYLAISRKWPEIQVDQESTFHPDRTEAEKEERRNALLDAINKSLETQFKSKRSKANHGDRERIKTFDKYRSFEKQPLVQNEVELLRRGNKFSLTDLSKHHQWGMEKCLNTIVAEALAEVPQPLARFNPISDGSMVFNRRFNSRAQLRPDSQNTSLPSGEPVANLMSTVNTQNRPHVMEEVPEEMTEEEIVSVLAEMQMHVA
jgi:hypothetical protein